MGVEERSTMSPALGSQQRSGPGVISLRDPRCRSHSDALSIRPKLPSTMEWGKVTNVAWRGHTLTVTVYRDHVDVRGMPGPIQHHLYGPGQGVVLDGARATP